MNIGKRKKSRDEDDDMTSNNIRFDNQLGRVKKITRHQETEDMDVLYNNSETNSLVIHDQKLAKECGIGHVVLYRKSRVHIKFKIANINHVDVTDINYYNVTKVLQSMNKKNKCIVIQMETDVISNTEIAYDIVFIEISKTTIEQLKKAPIKYFIFYVGHQELTNSNEKMKIAVYNGEPVDSDIAFLDRIGIKLPYKTSVIHIDDLHII